MNQFLKMNLFIVKILIHLENLSIIFIARFISNYLINFSYYFFPNFKFDFYSKKLEHITSEINLHIPIIHYSLIIYITYYFSLKNFLTKK